MRQTLQLACGWDVRIPQLLGLGKVGLSNPVPAPTYHNVEFPDRLHSLEKALVEVPALLREGSSGIVREAHQAFAYAAVRIY